jgi:hypothetical protein
MFKTSKEKTNFVNPCNSTIGLSSELTFHNWLRTLPPVNTNLLLEPKTKEERERLNFEFEFVFNFK